MSHAVFGNVVRQEETMSPEWKHLLTPALGHRLLEVGESTGVVLLECLIFVDNRKASQPSGGSFLKAQAMPRPTQLPVVCSSCASLLPSPFIECLHVVILLLSSVPLVELSAF